MEIAVEPVPGISQNSALQFLLQTDETQSGPDGARGLLERQDSNLGMCCVHQSEARIGCLLIDGTSSEDQTDLQYWGLIPSARGRGLALETLQLAQTIAARAGRTLLACADARNEPAGRAYARAGFLPYDRRQLFFRSLG